MKSLKGIMKSKFLRLILVNLQILNFGGFLFQLLSKQLNMRKTVLFQIYYYYYYYYSQ